MVDPDLELRKGPVLCFIFTSLPFFLPKIKGVGGAALPLDPPLQVDKYKEITGLAVYSLDI